MKICIVGLGYIGLPSGVMFATAGADVLGVDISPSVVQTLNAGEIHIEEPGLGEAFKKVVENKKFRASLTPETSDVFLISVPTPNLNDGLFSCDDSIVVSACKSIKPYVKKGDIIIVESTVAPRTLDQVVQPLFEDLGYVMGEDLFLAHCPERVLPGKILEELVYNNRIVGGITPMCAKKAADVYRLFVQGEIIETEAKTAEISKCMENTFRDVNIALVNELAKICYELDINVLDVIQLANKHPRVNLLQPGPGVGGHCLAIDPYFIYAKAPEVARLIKLSRDINVSMPAFVVEQVEKLVSDIKDPKITVFGLTYKGDIDDLRESPAIKIKEMLADKGYRLGVYDPHVHQAKYHDLNEAVKDSDLILILVDHTEFKQLDFNQLLSQVRHPLIFDTRNIIHQAADSSWTVINYGNLYQYTK